MIEASQLFYQSDLANNTVDNIEENDNVRFSEWQQVSSRAWRLARTKTNSVGSQLNSRSNVTEGDIRNDAHYEAVMASMDLYLSQQNDPLRSSKSSSSVMPGFIAGLDIADPFDRWVHDMQSFVSIGDSSRALYEDRQGIVVSAPLRLTAKTLSKSLLTMRNQTKPIPSDSDSTKFSLVSMGSGGPDCSAIDFSFYNSQKQDMEKAASNVYVPEGYEDFESLQRKGSGNQGRSKKSNPDYFIMEIQNILPSSLDCNTMLEDIACIWTDNTKVIHKEETHNTKNAEGIQTKVISCRSWKAILDQQLERNKESDMSWVLTELEEVAPLQMPQPVGYGWEASPSLILVVSFDTNHAQSMRGEQSKAARLLSKFKQFFGDIILKFRRQESVRNPVCSNVSLACFAIGRKFRVANHDTTKEAAVLKALQLSMLNAERFVPEWQKQQWDIFPSAFISVVAYATLPQNIANWLRNPTVSRSDFDLSLGNVLPQFYPYVDKNFIQGNLGHHIAVITREVQERIATVEYNRRVFSSGPHPGEVNAKTIYQANRAGACDMALLLQYISRMQTAVQIERLRCFNDMRTHDMYSIHWKNHTIEIAPPSKVKQNCPSCIAFPNEVRRTSIPCAYHYAATYIERESGRRPQPGKSIPVRSKGLLELLPGILSRMSAEDCLVARIHVPGVAENYPLVSNGDFVRLLFRSSGNVQMTTEVIAEVADVVLKFEEVVLKLPSPLQAGYSSVGCLPYLQSILHTSEFEVDAYQVLTALPRDLANPFPALAIEKIGEINVLDRYRFDVRFGFQGGRGFDIIQQVLDATTRGSMHPNSKIEIASHSFHVRRVLAPTKYLLPTAITKRELSFDGEELKYVNPINCQQQQAVKDILKRQHGSVPYIIEGPAGTGKTMCLCEAIIQVYRLEPNSRILVCAPSDAACDVLASRLLPRVSKDGHRNLLRINWWSRKVASVKPELLSSCPMNSSGVFTIPEYPTLKKAGIVVCQCFVAECLELVGPAGWMKQVMPNNGFTHLFIDETSQAMECEALVPMLKIGGHCSIVLAGDTKQLSPSIRDPVAAKMGLGLSIQERLLQLPLYTDNKLRSVTHLVSNYRSNEALLAIPSNLFYNGKLEALAPESVANPFQDFGDMGEAGFPLLLCDIPHGEERSKLDTPSFFNLDECHAIASLAKGILNCKSKDKINPLHTGEISVITPFRAQVLALRTVLRGANLGGINVGVVEDFQGQEAKVVFISTVLTRNHQRWKQAPSSTSGEDTEDNSSGVQRLSFLHDPKSFNVAITRAHALCVIVGHAAYLESSGTYWAVLMDHIRRNDGVLGVECDTSEDGHQMDDDPYGIVDLMRRVEALQLLGSGTEEGRNDLSYYYSDVPQWKVMLS